MKDELTGDLDRASDTSDLDSDTVSGEAKQLPAFPTNSVVDEKSRAEITTLLRYQNNSNDDGFATATLCFDNLTVSAFRDLEAPVKTLPRAILNTFGPDQYNFVKSKASSFFGYQKRSGTQKSLLTDFSGIVHPGEMLFVLGRPGSGCSTFLRTAASSGDLPVTGDLTYRNISASDFTRLHRRETIYLPEEDRHIASLTVKETIQFAVRTSLPLKVRTSVLVQELVQSIGSLFGLSHVLETQVGGAFSPGVSGGERKRVSIAEVFATGSTVQCFDNSTRGLDSSTALDFVKALRVLTDVGQKTTLATLYQAGEDIYRQFDKVLLIDEGREIYFGPATEARSFFEDLGFKVNPGLTTVEALLAFQDPSLRTATPDTPAADIQTTDDLAQAFRKSDRFSNLKEEISRHRAAPVVSGYNATSSYNLSFPRQILECLRREILLAKQQRRIYYIKWITTIILCLSCGSIYFDISSTAQGAFTRGGILFFALIFNGWLQFPELFDAHTNRAVIQRQAQLRLYRPSAVALARFLIDLPLIAFQHIIFIIPFYFLTRLQVDAGRFFFFYLTLFISTVNFSNLLRMFAYYVQTLDDCFRYGGFSCTVLLLFAGFLIPASDMRPYFGWLHYINPMYYGFENLFSSELDGLNIQCEDQSFIPDVGGAAALPNRICAVRGAVAGQNFVSGIDYVMAYGLHFSHRWRNIGIMIAIALAYLFVGAVGSEIMSFGSQSASVLFFTRKAKKSRSALEEPHDIEKLAANSEQQIKNDALLQVDSRPALTWENLKVKIGDKEILEHISGISKRGELIALCGASGAGKTTLLSALSHTMPAGAVNGEILFRNSPLSPNSRKFIGFAQQMDLHDGTATVREALEFSALLRQPRTFSPTEKLAYVDTVLDLLDLRRYENYLIGDESFGLGLEYKKRVTIAVELAARPEVLFVDEPTSGLDSQGAMHIVSHLQNIAHNGQAVIATIHQPSALLFSKFDKLLVLSSEGRQVYFGAISKVLAYFSANGALCPSDRNPLEFILETIGAGVHAKQTDKSSTWADRWRGSTEAAALQNEINGPKSDESTLDVDDEGASGFNATTLEQTRLLTLRILRNQWRNTPYMYSKIWVHVISSILVGFTFYQVGTSPSDLQNRAFSVYFILFLVNAIVNVILIRYFLTTLYWQLREGPSRTYGWVALVSASILAEIPGTVLVTVLYFLLWYLPSGLPLSEAGYIFLVLLTYEVFQVLFGLFMMALSPDLGFAGNVLVFLVCTCNWFNGIIVPYEQIQVFWRYWLYYLSPFTYLLGGMVQAATSSVAVVCNSKDIITFDPPSGSTCGQYAADWAATTSAQLLNPDATSHCNVCQWTTGDQFLASLNLGPDGLLAGNKWAFWGVFVGFTVSNLFLVYFFTWATKVKHWKLFYFF